MMMQASASSIVPSSSATLTSAGPNVPISNPTPASSKISQAAQPTTTSSPGTSRTSVSTAIPNTEDTAEPTTSATRSNRIRTTPAPTITPTNPSRPANGRRPNDGSRSSGDINDGNKRDQRRSGLRELGGSRKRGHPLPSHRHRLVARRLDSRNEGGMQRVTRRAHDSQGDLKNKTIILSKLKTGVDCRVASLTTAPLTRWWRSSSWGRHERGSLAHFVGLRSCAGQCETSTQSLDSWLIRQAVFCRPNRFRGLTVSDNLSLAKLVGTNLVFIFPGDRYANHRRHLHLLRVVDARTVRLRGCG